MAPRNKSTGFRSIWFVSGFGSWVGARPLAVEFSTAFRSTKEGNARLLIFLANGGFFGVAFAYHLSVFWRISSSLLGG